MRIRTVKPEFHQHEELAKLPREDRLLAVALLNWADDEGYFKSAPQLISGSLFPFDDDGRAFVTRGLAHLVGVGFICLYENGIGHIVKFSAHQVIGRASESKLKPKAGAPLALEDSMRTPCVLTEDSLLEGNREQGSGTGNGSAGKTSPAEPKPQKALKLERPPDPRHAPMVEALTTAYREENFGAEYAFGGRDAKCVQDLLAKSDDDEEIVFRWRTAIRLSLDKFHTPKTRTLADFVRDWNAYPAVKNANITREMRL